MPPTTVLADLLQIPNAAAPTGGQGFVLPLSGVQPLMLAAVGARSVAFGTGTETWPGGTQQGATITVTHGLGTTPALVFVIGSTGAFMTSYVVFTLGSTTFQTRGWAATGTPAAASSETFYWLAIG